MKLNVGKVALAMGVFFAALHAAWSLLILSGYAQGLVDWVLWAHMIHLQYVVGPFDPTAAISLLVYTFIMGYAIGWVFAWIWNKLHR